MSFNLDSSKQAQEVIFSRKSKRSTQLPLVFNNNNVKCFSQNNLAVILNFKWTFEDHPNNVVAKVNKAVGLYTQTLKFITKDNAFYYIQSFTRSHLGYGDFLYDQAFNEEKLESIQCNACLDCWLFKNLGW